MLHGNQELNGPKKLTGRLQENGIMKRDATDILRDALELPPEARAALAGSLLDSLDQTVDEDAESAWQAEIMTRLKELDQGRVQLVPWVEARRRITGR
jgi:putative addiction module component (TIGR02574 family)